MPTATLTAPRRHQLLGLAGWMGLTVGAGALGALASRDAPTFYASLDRPPWAPPASLFGPVWTTLYLAIALAAWLVWRERAAPGRTRLALALYVAQLIPNALWSWLFFSWRLGGAALVDIVVLLALIALTIAAFWRVRRVAALLLLPYLAWVAFATALTASLMRRNPALL